MAVRRGLGTRMHVLAILVSIGLIVGIGVYVSVRAMGASSKEQTTTQRFSDGFVKASTTSTRGIQLSAEVNATSLIVGQDLNVSVSDFNTLPDFNILPSSQNWTFAAIPVGTWTICYNPLPISVDVLPGNLTVQQFPAFSHPSFGVACEAYANMPRLVFYPQDDRVNITSASNSTVYTAGYPFHASSSFTIGGYWNLNNLSNSTNLVVNTVHVPSSNAFGPGVYTLGVEDEWGQVVLIHFQVEASP